MTADQAPMHWILTLYISGASMRSSTAVEAIRRICDEELPGQVELTIVDVRDEPALVVREGILAVPTLVKQLPAPLRRLVGDLANASWVRAELDLTPGPHDTGEGQTP